MSAPGPGSVENTASILKSICGRTAEGVSQACPHDHLGEAMGLHGMIRAGLLRELIDHKGSLTPDVLEDLADAEEKRLA